MQTSMQSTNLLELLEKILDKGLVIAGDIKITLADVELLTIKIRLIVASVDKAKEIGLDWWERDPYLSSKASALEDENRVLSERIAKLEQQIQQVNNSQDDHEEEGGLRLELTGGEDG